VEKGGKRDGELDFGEQERTLSVSEPGDQSSQDRTSDHIGSVMSGTEKVKAVSSRSAARSLDRAFHLKTMTRLERVRLT
jgi:hypothetical protein